LLAADADSRRLHALASRSGPVINAPYDKLHRRRTTGAGPELNSLPSTAKVRIRTVPRNPPMGRSDPISPPFLHGLLHHEAGYNHVRGICDLVMEICWALHDFRVRLAPWQPMI
jgi:hypothetical protein